jgi:hypothetical protein
MNYIENNLVGTWKTDQRKPFDEAQDGDVVIDFNEDGTAKYSIYYPEKRGMLFILRTLSKATTSSRNKAIPSRSRHNLNLNEMDRYCSGLTALRVDFFV